MFVDAVVGGVTGDLRDDGVGEVGGEVIEVRRGSENLSPKSKSNLEFTLPGKEEDGRFSGLTIFFLLDLFLEFTFFKYHLSLITLNLHSTCTYPNTAIVHAYW